MMRLRCADEQIAFRKTKTEPFGNYTAENLLSSLFPWFDVHLRTLELNQKMARSQICFVKIN